MTFPSAGITQFRCLAVGRTALSAPIGAPAFLCSGLYARSWPRKSSRAHALGLSTEGPFGGDTRPARVRGGRGRDLGNDHDHAPVAGGAGRGNHRLLAAPE